MAKAYVFYNPLAGQGKILEDLDALQFVLDIPSVLCDMTKPETYGEALFAMDSDDYLVLCGGDGTLNRFVNLTGELQRSNAVYYYPAGDNNDFALDFGRRYGMNPFPVTDVLKTLPEVQLGDRTFSFLTGVLFFAARKNRRTSKQKQSYTEENMPQRVKVSVDRALRHFENVRFAAVMQGKHCNGGMVPDAGRRRTDGDFSCVLIHSCGRLKGNYLLRQLQKGRNPESRCLTILRGGDVRLDFETPISILVDGEGQRNVKELRVRRKEAT